MEGASRDWTQLGLQIPGHVPWHEARSIQREGAARVGPVLSLKV